jgi:hypothetical protein
MSLWKRDPNSSDFNYFESPDFYNRFEQSNQNIKQFLSSQMWSIAKFGYIFLWMMMASQFGYQCNKIIKLNKENF